MGILFNKCEKCGNKFFLGNYKQKYCRICLQENPSLDIEGYKRYVKMGYIRESADAFPMEFTLNDFRTKPTDLKHCIKCGIKIDSFDRKLSTKYICYSCRRKYAAYLQKPNVKSCNKCGYFEELIHERGGIDEFAGYVDESYTTFKCRKFHLALNEDKYLLAQKCKSYLSKEEYEEKCLAGEMEKENQAPKEWTCAYCQVINTGKFCTNCGSPKRKQEQSLLSAETTA